MERKESGKTTILVTHDMGAVKKYCNRAVLIENGLVKAYGDPFDVANQYSYDNTAPLKETQKEQNQGDSAEKIKPKVENFKLELLSSNQITPNDDINFKIEYDVMEDVETYIGLSLTDIDRNVWIYNDNTLDNKTKGIGHKTAYYSCKLSSVNNLKLKLEVTVRDVDGNMLAFTDATTNPIIVINRDDIASDDISALDSATGIIQRNGTWKFK